MCIEGPKYLQTFEKNIKANMKTNKGDGATDVSENILPQDEPSFRKSPRTRLSSLLEISTSSPVFQRSIASKLAMKKTRPIINKPVGNIQEDNIVSSPASPIIGRRRPTIAKRMAILEVKSFNNTSRNEESISLGPEKEIAETIKIAKEILVSSPLSVRKSTCNLMSPPLSEQKNYLNETQNNVKIKEPVKRKTRNNRPFLDKENILNPDEVDVPVKRMRRGKTVTEMTRQEPVSNLEKEGNVLDKRTTRGRKLNNSKENKVEEIANLVEKVTNQQKTVPKTRKGKKNYTEENKEVTKESSDNCDSRSKEDNTSNSKGIKGSHSKIKNMKNNKSEDLINTNFEPLHITPTPSAPRRGRRAAALEIKNTEKQTKIYSFLSVQPLDKSTVTSKRNTKNIQSTMNNGEKKTKAPNQDFNKSNCDDITHTPKRIEKTMRKITQSPRISGRNQNKQKLPIWATVANQSTKTASPGSRKSLRRSVGSGQKDVFEFSFDLENDENVKKKKKKNTKPRVRKAKPKSQLKSTLLVTDPSWQKPMPHSRTKNATPYTSIKNSLTSSATKSLSKKEALAAKIRAKKQTDESGTTSSQESQATSGYLSQASKQFTSQDSSYIKDKRAPEHYIGAKTPKQVRAIPDINFDDDDDGCDIQDNDLGGFETEEVVERLEYETTSSFRPPQSNLISESVLPTPDVSRFFSKFIGGSSTPMTEHVKSSNIFRDPEPPKTVVASTPMTKHVNSSSICCDPEPPKTVVASTPMTNHVKSSSIFHDPEPPKTVVEDLQQCFGFEDNEAQHNPLDLSPVRNSFAHPSIINCLEFTGMSVPEEDRQPSRFDYGSIYRGNRGNISSSMITHGRSIPSAPASKSRSIQKNVSKQKVESKKSPAPIGSIKKYIPTSRKSPSSNKKNKVSENTFPKDVEMDHQTENFGDKSVLFDEEPLEEAVINKPQHENGSKSQENTETKKFVPACEIPSPTKSFSEPARKIYDRHSLNESRHKFLLKYSGADVSNLGDNEDDEEPKKQKTSIKSKKVNNKGKKSNLKSGNEKASKKVPAKRACKNTRKVSFGSSGESSFDTSQEEEKKLKMKSKKDRQRDKSVEDWASDINSHFSEVEDIELVIG
ncbi:unnamed protein product [Meganyctiphanes norvegica]|uniref:Uncharacterized protein n=1 Tax=Meganyctiphanes norvegica TaxID=48144 RepID=A0AAV2RUQ2_MEGNR